MSKQCSLELMDCGRASARTRGLAFLIAYENVNPPFNRMYLIGF
jgi:hypothetical protein